MTYTISTHNGSTVARGHNIRDRRITDKEDHIDPAGVHEIWHDETERQAYHRIFDKAQNDYNARQDRKDRQIKNYYADVSKDDKKHTVYEMIAAVGSRENPPDPETGRAILREFVDKWQKRNPNLEMIGAYYHADEQGVPHVHIDYVPVAHGYRRGMETQTGLVKALKEQGFVMRGKTTAQIQWEHSENKALEDICRAHGLEIEHPEAGKGTEHAHTEAYQIVQDARHEALAAQKVADDILTDAKQKAAQIGAGAAQKAQETRAQALQDYNTITLTAERDAATTRNEAAAAAQETRQAAQKEADDVLTGAKQKAAQIDAETAQAERNLRTVSAKAQQMQDSIDSDKAQAAEVIGRVKAAVAGVDDLKGWSPEVISETPERKRFGGKVDPATVTISRDDLDRVKQVSDAGAVVKGYNKAAKALQNAQTDLAQTARQVHMTAKQSHEVGVDERVREADGRTAQADRRAQDAERHAQAEKAAREAADRERDQALERERQAQQELILYRETLAFFPDDWEQMQKRTARAREMERLYYKAQELPRGESAPGLEYNRWAQGYSYQLSDGTSFDRRHLLKEYVAECGRQDIPHDTAMWDDAQKAIESLEQDEWSR